MSHYLNQTSKVILDKYKGDLNNLREEAKHDPVKVRELVKAFKVGRSAPFSAVVTIYPLQGRPSTGSWL